MKYLVLILFLLFGTEDSFGQKNKNPKNIAEAIAFLDKDWPDSLKVQFKSAADGDLHQLDYYSGKGYKTVYNWTTQDKKRSRLRKFLAAKGVENSWNQENVILISFKHHLLGKEINLDDIIAPFKEKEDQRREEWEFNRTADTIDETYIPKNLADCFEQMDILIPDSLKTKIKQYSEDEFIANSHFEIGMAARNDWKLWNNSRLARYFNKKGINHPDDMSGIILKSYHRHLTGKKLKLKKQIRYYQAYWKAITAPSEKIYPKGIKDLEFDHKVYYYDEEKRRYGFVHIQTNSKSDKTWIYDYYLGWKLANKLEITSLESLDEENGVNIVKQIFNKQKAEQ